ncbi:hypothetical protein CUT44_18150 [Streptomyces carminius]|uniref:Uncharacterized protein n=1 Tax=Streptomyces carminius TaxID=2665496 RepID=A0A2M8LWT4_9ACTN|nr:DUF6236 family protein [Streptomyces carminius]PJE96426.1 hypothetical protein CUT44_18150 [Streptomyces carminius]
MTGTPAPPGAGQRSYGLYHPYFHVRDDRWLKAAALYWPRIVRMVPEDYATRDSETVKVLTGELGFVERLSPGASVASVAPRFLELVSGHADALRPRLGVGQEDAARLRHAARPGGPGPGPGPAPGAVHHDQLRPEVVDALVDAGLAVRGRIDLSHEADRRWVVMDERLVAVYTSVPAEDVAAANRLQLTTDRPHAYAVANGWSADRIAEALLDGFGPVGPGTPDPGNPEAAAPERGTELAQRVALLALNLVVPEHLDRVPVQRIVALRRRHEREFLEFGRAVDQAAAELSELAGISDPRILEQYLRDEVESRFALPLKALRRHLQELRLGAATMAVNVRTQLPATLTLAGGAWLAGQPVVAGTTATALGLLTVRQSTRQQKEELLGAAGPASFLLHARGELGERKLLARTLGRMGRIAGTGG